MQRLDEFKELVQFRKNHHGVDVEWMQWAVAEIERLRHENERMHADYRTMNARIVEQDDEIERLSHELEMARGDVCEGMRKYGRCQG